MFVHKFYKVIDQHELPGTVSWVAPVAKLTGLRNMFFLSSHTVKEPAISVIKVLTLVHVSLVITLNSHVACNS